MKPLIIFGTGDIARLALFYFQKDAATQVCGFTVDRSYLPASQTFCDLPVWPFEDIASLKSPEHFSMFIALSYSSMNGLRKEKYMAAKQKGYKLASYVSPHCTYLSENPPGDNCFILEDNTIQPFVKIENNVTLWSGNHIGHDAVIRSHVFISSHVVVSGHVEIGERCFLGVNATLRNSIKIAENTLIGAGCTIMKDTQPGEVYLPPRPHLSDKNSSDVNL